MSFPGTHDFELYQGDSDVLRYTFLEGDAARTPVNLSASSILLTAKRELRDAIPVILLEAHFANPAAGEFEFNIAPAITDKFGALSKPMDLYYDMQYKHLDTVITIVYGKIRITPEVTRDNSSGRRK